MGAVAGRQLPSHCHHGWELVDSSAHEHTMPPANPHSWAVKVCGSPRPAQGWHLVHLDARRLLGPPGDAGHLLAAARKAHEHRGAGAPAQRLGRAVAVPALGRVAVYGHNLQGAWPGLTHFPHSWHHAHFVHQWAAHRAFETVPQMMALKSQTLDQATFYPDPKSPSPPLTSSPGSTPARSAGPPRMGATTSRRPSVAPMSRPTPCTSPSLLTRKSAYSLRGVSACMHVMLSSGSLVGADRACAAPHR